MKSAIQRKNTEYEKQVKRNEEKLSAYGKAEIHVGLEEENYFFLSKHSLSDRHGYFYKTLRKYCKLGTRNRKECDKVYEEITGPGKLLLSSFSAKGSHEVLFYLAYFCLFFVSELVAAQFSSFLKGWPYTFKYNFGKYLTLDYLGMWIFILIVILIIGFHIRYRLLRVPDFYADLESILLDRDEGSVSRWSISKGVIEKVYIADVVPYCCCDSSYWVKFRGTVYRYKLELKSKTKDQSLSFQISQPIKRVYLLWNFVRHYLDTSRPLPDIPILETARLSDPSSNAADLKRGRKKDFWRSMSSLQYRQVLAEKNKTPLKIKLPWFYEGIDSSQ